VINVRGMRCTPYLIGDSVYPIHSSLQKNFKTHNVEDINKRKFDSSMNSRRVVIENAFGSLKTRWKILKHFNSRVDRATKVTIVYCVLHNYFELCGEPEPKVVNPKEEVMCLWVLV
jgi:hypothetical protein